ncbi:NAD-binding protein [Escherichia coli]|nr:NAD-binding protein [Escherichia coli]
MAAIAFIGLGQMGSPMASNLLQQGHQLRVFDVNAEAVRHLVDKGATPAANPAQAAKDAEFIITMLPNGDLVRSVLFGENGVCESLSTDALVIDMSTIHPLQTDKLIADMQAKGFSMMDVPVGRTSANAITGTLLLLAGGTAAGKGHFTTSWPNKVLSGDLSPAFMIDLAHKDLGIALDVANQLHVPMPLGAASREVYSQARAAGRGRQDWSAILEQVRVSAGMTAKVKM